MKLEERLPALLQGGQTSGPRNTDDQDPTAHEPDTLHDTLHHALRLPDEDGGWVWHELRLRVARRDPRGRARQVLASLQDIQGAVPPRSASG